MPGDRPRAANWESQTPVCLGGNAAHCRPVSPADGVLRVMLPVSFGKRSFPKLTVFGPAQTGQRFGAVAVYPADLLAWGFPNGLLGLMTSG